MRPYLNFSESTQGMSIGDSSIDSVTIKECLQLVSTPCYITSLNAVSQRIKAYRASTSRHFKKSVIHYAVKANFAPEVLTEVIESGGGLDIVSPGELRASQRALCPPDLVCYAGVGKKPKDLEEALHYGVGKINVEHIIELNATLEMIRDINANAINSARCATQILIRWNPCLEIETHPHLRTGALDSKFGILDSEIIAYLIAKKNTLSEEDFETFVRPLVGIHVHLGSQVQNAIVYKILCEKLVEFAGRLVDLGVQLNCFDLGGGLGVGELGVPNDASDIDAHVDFVCVKLKKSLKNSLHDNVKYQNIWGENLQHVCVALEPGRSVVASSSVFVTEVLYTKSNSENNCFVYVDGGMNDFPRPSIYSAKHELIGMASAAPISSLSDSGGLDFWNATTAVRCAVVGPVCESADVLAKDVLLPRLVSGAHICFFEAGAYCKSMASHYNLRPLPAEVFVKDGKIQSWRQQVWP